MKFKNAVQDTPDLNNHWCSGLQALSQVDIKHISAEDTGLLAGSVNVDSALKEKCQNDPRWDYAIGHRPSNLKGEEIVYWVEIHPATNGELKKVLGKLQWLKRRLMDWWEKLNSMKKRFVWVSSGKTDFTLSSTQRKRLAAVGLDFKGRLFKIPNEC